jgi:hypothetical protein
MEFFCLDRFMTDEIVIPAANELMPICKFLGCGRGEGTPPTTSPILPILRGLFIGRVYATLVSRGCSGSRDDKIKDGPEGLPM